MLLASRVLCSDIGYRVAHGLVSSLLRHRHTCSSSTANGSSTISLANILVLYLLRPPHEVLTRFRVKVIGIVVFVVPSLLSVGSVLVLGCCPSSRPLSLVST